MKSYKQELITKECIVLYCISLKWIYVIMLFNSSTMVFKPIFLQPGLYSKVSLCVCPLKFIIEVFHLAIYMIEKISILKKGIGIQSEKIMETR